MKANHEHDCDNCNLVHVQGNKDLYVCRREDGRASWILRYSSEESDYESYPETMIYMVSKASFEMPLIDAMVEAGVDIDSLPREEAA